MGSEENKDNQLNNNQDSPSTNSETDATKRFTRQDYNDETLNKTNEQTIVRKRRSQEKVKPEIKPNAANEEKQSDEASKSVSKRREAKKAKKEKKLTKGRIRYIPVWLRVILVTILCGGAFIGGLMIGYGTIGEGEDMRTILDRELWDSIFDYIRGE